MADKPTPDVLRGAAALMAMLYEIGGDPDRDGDKTVARIMVENERPLRDMLQYVVQVLSEEI